MTRNINWSLSLVQYHRFLDERTEYQKKIDRELLEQTTKEGKSDKKLKIDIKPGNEEFDNVNQNKPMKLLDVVRDVYNMLDYDRGGFLHLILFLINFLVLVSQIVKSIAFIALNTDCDPVTNEFNNHVLRFLESTFYLTDVVYKIDQTGFINLTLGLLSTQYLILRIRSFSRRIMLSKLNRHQYMRIYKTDEDLLSSAYLRADLKSWLKLIKLATHSKCQCEDHRLLLRGENGKKMKEMNKRMLKYGRMDRVYFYNPIEFNCCYEGTGFLYDCVEQEAKDEKRNEAQRLKEIRSRAIREKLENSPLWINRVKSVIYLTKESIEKYVRYIFAIDLPDYRPYTPEPMHRIQPIHLSWLVLAFINVSIFQISNYVLTLASIIKIGLREQKALDNVDQYSVDDNTTGLNHRALLGIGHSAIVLFMFAMDYNDCGLVAQAFIFCRSRTNKVVEMLKREASICRSHMKTFNKFLEDNKLALDELSPNVPHSESFQKEASKQSLSYRRPRQSICLNDSLIWPDYDNYTTGLSRQDSGNNEDDYYDHNDNDKQDNGLQTYLYHYFDLETHRFDNRRPISLESAIGQYKTQISEQSLAELNENIEYLLDLIGVLENEFHDLRDYFTFFINVSTIFGSIIFSISYALLDKADSSEKSQLAMNSLGYGLAPMVYSLFVGATSEQSVSTEY